MSYQKYAVYFKSRYSNKRSAVIVTASTEQEAIRQARFTIKGTTPVDRELSDVRVVGRVNSIKVSR